VGTFADDQRAGQGVFYWRDGTVYRGQFAANKMHGWGIKRQPNGAQDIQHWHVGDLEQSAPVVSHDRCQLDYLERAWMFTSDQCINGRAHGRGVAVSIDGSHILLEGRIVLGHVVSGELLVLPQEAPVAKPVSADRT